MIRRIIIRVLLIFMVIAFVAVVSVQWIWIKSSIQERDDRFRIKVYDVLSQTVSFIDEIDNKRILTELADEFAKIQEKFREADTLRNDSLQVSTPPTAVSNYTLWNDNRRSYLTYPMIPSSADDRYLDRQLIDWFGELFGANRQENRQNWDKKDYLDVLTELSVRIANEEESVDVKIKKLRESRSLDIHSYLREKLGNVDIRIPFTYEIMEERGIQLRSLNKNIKGFYYVLLFPKLDPVKKYYLAIIFDSEESLDMLIYENMDWMFIISAFCVFGLMAIFIITILVITRQQKLSLIKNDFINNMTHEFKTPLATISLATSAIEKEKVLNDKAQLLKFNTIIQGENERMSKYVERILLQAKLDRREIHLKRELINLNVLVDDAVQHFRLQVEDAGGEMWEELDPEGLVMKADEVHLLNVFCNLIDNAIKYSGKSIKIYVSTRKEGGNFVIGVQDSGIGIPKEAQKKVFKRFYRVPSGNLHNVKGFGLGLSYVKSIVALHGGEIRLTSKKNKGTLVEILFKQDKE